MNKNLSPDEAYKDILKEIGNIGSGNAATALSKILNNQIDMKLTSVQILEFNQVTEMLGGNELLVVGILIPITGDIKGSILYIIEKQYADKICDKLLTNFKKELKTQEHIRLSALKEIGNIMAASYLCALSNLTGLKITPSVPDIAIDMASSILSVPAVMDADNSDNVIYIGSQFLKTNNNSVGEFFLIPDKESLKILIKSLGVNNDG